MSTDIWTGANDRELREVQRLGIEAVEEAQSDLDEINDEIRKRGLK